jgi:hypothetical protein
MKTFARITAIILIITGILILFGGLALGITGSIRFLMNATPAARTLRAGGPIGLITLAFVSIEGLSVSALGEGLYLLADISNKLPPH